VCSTSGVLPSALLPTASEVVEYKAQGIRMKRTVLVLACSQPTNQALVYIVASLDGRWLRTTPTRSRFCFASTSHQQSSATHSDAMACRVTGSRVPRPPPMKRYGAPATIPGGKATVGSMELVHRSFMGAQAAAVLACVTATLVVLPLLLPPLPPPPLLFMLVPVAIFAVLVSLVLVPSHAAAKAEPPRLDRPV
jgi:hypothetical protein